MHSTIVVNYDKIGVNEHFSVINAVTDNYSVSHMVITIKVASSENLVCELQKELVVTVLMANENKKEIVVIDEIHDSNAAS